MMTNTLVVTSKGYLTQFAPKDKPIHKFKIILDEKPEDIIGIADWIKQPVDIEEIIFSTDSRTTHEHIQILLDNIRQHNNAYLNKKINKLTLISTNYMMVENPMDLKNLCNLFSPTQDFQFQSDYDQGFEEMFIKLIEVLRSGTNFNQFFFQDKCLFGGYFEAAGFKDFAAFIIDKNWPITKIHLTNTWCTDAAFLILIQLIERSPTLEDLSLDLVSSLCKIDGWISAIANSNIKRLSIVQQYESNVGPEFGIGICEILKKLISLEYLDLTITDANLSDDDIIEALKGTQSLRTLSLSPPLRLTLLSQKWLPTNESMTKIIYQQDHVPKEVHEQIIEITSRNKNLLKERIKSTIVLLYNIARFNTSNTIDSAMPRLPNEIWAIIASYFKYPAVTVDFGSIARLIFKDQSIRRVL